jgi:GT2 family glycosyltransferase
LPGARVTVVIPTLQGGEKLARCLEHLRAQTFRDFDVVIVDNSGARVAAAYEQPPQVRVIHNRENLGFGAAINQAINQAGAEGSAEFILALNDDAYPAPEWIAELVAACEADPAVGMCASKILLRDGRIDSAGLDIYGDGTTKQHGNGEPSDDHNEPREALLPSGCAALYRGRMLDETGAFDADYFLYGEDADLGLRAQLLGWRCRYVPSAVVVHDYSSSAGRASPMKAYYVERNRLYTVLKVFPAYLWPLTPCYALWRYLAHFGALVAGRGLAAEYRGRGEKWWQLVLIVGSAHWSALRHLPDLLEKRRVVRRSARLGTLAFWRLLRRHYVTATRVAWQ